MHLEFYAALKGKGRPKMKYSVYLLKATSSLGKCPEKVTIEPYVLNAF